jgi:hypothetical protein
MKGKPEFAAARARNSLPDSELRQIQAVPAGSSTNFVPPSGRIFGLRKKHFIVDNCDHGDINTRACARFEIPFH